MAFRVGKSNWFIGLGLGLVVGLVVAGFWPQTPLHAVATDRSETFAVATGYCDESVEAIWFLDFLTGDLRAAVVSKQTGTFNAFYVRNISEDLGVDPNKSPHFLMVTGAADLRRSGGSRVSPSRSILYIAEITTGKVAAYSIPWSSAAWVAGQRMGGEIVRLDVTRFRTAAGAGAAGAAGTGKAKGGKKAAKAAEEEE